MNMNYQKCSYYRVVDPLENLKIGINIREVRSESNMLGQLLYLHLDFKSS